MMSLTEMLFETRKKREKYFENYLEYAKKIKERAREILGEVKVFVFGSVLKGDYHPVLSDIDILIVSPKAPKDASEKSKIKIKILSEFELGNPFEIHLVTPEDYEDWYSRFIKEKIEI
jgi:hypothetical protein